MRTLYAKFPGTCATCGTQFSKGALIDWQGRGNTSHHTCPGTAISEQLAPCWDCQSPNGRLRNYGASTPCLCDSCESKRRDRDKNRFNARDHSSHEDRCCGDTAYEDACARACGL